ncbi:hypothetical protein RRG08_004107 [Elysia crispata]|uniref:Uncharacterized protein n=1 Tax=Elysia crispata TaxID=231223 RepID=A0AAE0YWC2_9GAST|nr:hypothetical protein RRG08_004107 [Elysia crispata]
MTLTDLPHFLKEETKVILTILGDTASSQFQSAVDPWIVESGAHLVLTLDFFEGNKKSNNREIKKKMPDKVSDLPNDFTRELINFATAMGMLTMTAIKQIALFVLGILEVVVAYLSKFYGGA